METPNTMSAVMLVAGLLALFACAHGEARYPSQSQLPVVDPQFHNGFHLPGMCMAGKACDSCPSDRKASVYRMQWVGWLKYKKVEQTVCCPTCGGTFKYKQMKEDYTCMCPPVETCLRGRDCDKCDTRYVTQIYGSKYCCENCAPASISLKHMGMMSKCDCNMPVGGGSGKDKRQETTDVPDSSAGSGELA